MRFAMRDRLRLAENLSVMGLFDFYKRKPVEDKKNDGPSPEYAFAHLALRQLALTDPLFFLSVIASPDAKRFLNAVLEDVNEKCGRKASFDAEAVKIYTVPIGDFPCVILEFPSPKEMALAHMVALVALVDQTVEQPEDSQIPARYFTLEKGIGVNNSPRTVLAEWDTETHFNYGDGPQPTAKTFALAIEEHLKPEAAG